MRNSCTAKGKNIYNCSCSSCGPVDLETIFPVKPSYLRKTKSTNIIRGNFDSVDIEIFQPTKTGIPSKSPKAVELLYRRSCKSNTTLEKSFTNYSIKHSANNSPNRGKNSYGIWRRCHDSVKYRMPWSMANSHRDNHDKLADSHIADGANNSKQDLDARVFPFQPTPSGNLKVIPQQVVFESKKVSVLVADPRHTKVNIKAELAKQQGLATNSGVDIPNLKDLKMMDSEEARNVKKHQILSAITMMGGEARGAALSQLMSPGMPPGMGMPPIPKFKVTGQGSGTNEDGHYIGELHDDHDREDGRSVDSDDSPKPEVNLIKLGFMGSTPIDWNKVKLPQKTNLYKHMHYRITNYVNPDCLVQIDDVQFNCHLLVLQCYSAFFNEKTAKDVVKLPPENVSPKAFELIYEWMTYVHGDSYTILTRDNILEVFLAAQFLGIKELEEQCWAFVDCEDLFKEDTAFMLYLEAKKYGISAIMELMIPRVMKFFLTLVSSKDFLELHLDEVHVLLSSNYISVHSEIEVFMSAVRWLWHDWKERKESLEQIMSCIRFGLIAPWQLVDIRRNPENPEFLEITSHPGVQQMIDNGLAYAIIKYWYGNQTEDYYHWIDLLGLSEPPSRNWAGEEKNYVTYREFLHDLELYRKELCYEKEKSRSKRDSVSVSKTKRGNEQSGLTTSPRDTLQQQSERKSSTKKHSPISVKTSSLADSMRSEIVNGHGEPRKSNIHSLVPPPPTIWNANTVLKDLPLVSSSNRVKLETISERDKYDKFTKSAEYTSSRTYQTLPAYSTSFPRKDFLRSECRLSEIRSMNQATLNAHLKRENAVIIIQRAYRSYKSRIRLRHHLQNKKQSLNSPTHSRKSHRSNRQSSNHSRRAKESSLGYPKSILLKDYLKEGSIFFADRESVVVFGGIDPHSKYGDGRNTGRNIFRYHSEVNQWELVGELPQPRHHHAVAFLKGRIYLAGGTDPRDDDKGRTVVVGTVWSFEPITRAWYNETDMQTPRKNFGLVVMNGKLLAIGGQDRDGRSPLDSECQQHNYMIVMGYIGRYEACVPQLAGDDDQPYEPLYLVTGKSSFLKEARHCRIISSVERYDTVTGTWEYIAPLNVERTGAAAAKYRDTVWVAGGMTESRKNPLTYSVESYDPKLNIWVQQSPLRFPRCFGCLFAMNDILYLIGGAGRAFEKERKTSSCNAIDVWNPKEEEWNLHFAMSTPRHGHAVAYLGTQILIIGGVTTAYMRALTDIECFCCERKTWVQGLASLPVPLSGHGAATLPPASLI